MSALLEKYGLDKLSGDEKSMLILDLEESLARELESEPESSEVLAMLEERLSRIDTDRAKGTDQSVPWETVLAEARARWSK